MTWREVAERCYQRRYHAFDVTVGVVVGAADTVVIDTRASVAQGVELRHDLGELGVRNPTVVNTHGHFDHCFGNAVFAGPRWGHVSLPGYLRRTARAALAEEFPEWAAAVAGDVLAPPDRHVRDRARIDLGDRLVELRYFGRGHTGGDIVAWVPDAGCAFVGDLLEESGPPSYGPDSFPLRCPVTVAALLEAVDGVLVPGHGAAVDRAFAVAQHERISLVARLVRECFAAGLGVAEALGAGGWPFPPESLANAVRRGYRELGRR